MKIMPVNFVSVKANYKNYSNKTQKNNNHNVSYNSNVYFKGIEPKEKSCEIDASKQAKINYMQAKKVLKEANSISTKIKENFPLAKQELQKEVEQIEKSVKCFKQRNFKDLDGNKCVVEKNYQRDNISIIKSKKTDANGKLISNIVLTYDGHYETLSKLHIEELASDNEYNILDYDYKTDTLVMKQGVKKEDKATFIKIIYEIKNGSLTSYKKDSSVFSYGLANEKNRYETTEGEFNFSENGQLLSFNKSVRSLFTDLKEDGIPSGEKTNIQKRFVFADDRLQACMENLVINMHEMQQNQGINRIFETRADMLFDYTHKKQGALSKDYKLINGAQSFSKKIGFSFE